MIESVGDSLPAILSTSLAMVFMSALTLYVARKSGVSDISAAASRESDRLVAAQSKRITLLEKKVNDLLSENKRLTESLAKANSRIDDLEELISDAQLRRLDRRHDHE